MILTRPFLTRGLCVACILSSLPRIIRRLVALLDRWREVLYIYEGNYLDAQKIYYVMMLSALHKHLCCCLGISYMAILILFRYLLITLSYILSLAFELEYSVPAQTPPTPLYLHIRIYCVPLECTCHLCVYRKPHLH